MVQSVQLSKSWEWAKLRVEERQATTFFLVVQKVESEYMPPNLGLGKNVEVQGKEQEKNRDQETKEDPGW
jgi:hypothetical protein